MSVKPFQPEYYTDDAGEVRWRVRGDNGEIVDSSSEGFANLRKAWDNYNLGLQGRQVTFEEAKVQHDHTEDDGAAGPSSGGLIADNAGSAGEGQEADGSGDAQTARGSAAGGSGTDGENPGA